MARVGKGRRPVRSAIPHGWRRARPRSAPPARRRDPAAERQVLGTLSAAQRLELPLQCRAGLARRLSALRQRQGHGHRRRVHPDPEGADVPVQRGQDPRNIPREAPIPKSPGEGEEGRRADGRRVADPAGSRRFPERLRGAPGMVRARIQFVNINDRARRERIHGYAGIDRHDEGTARQRAGRTHQAAAGEGDHLRRGRCAGDLLARDHPQPEQTGKYIPNALSDGLHGIGKRIRRTQDPAGVLRRGRRKDATSRIYGRPPIDGI